MSSVPSPLPDTSSKSPAPAVESEKSKRYDRQIRLWGDHGQSAIEAAHVCLIHANATGTEILKNLILPGIGAFTIIDSENVKPEDVSVSFFLQPVDIGANRGKSVTFRLLELNNDVKGDFREEPIDDLLEHTPELFHKFSLVIACDLVKSSQLIKLSDILYRANIPLVLTKVNGLFGYLRLQVKEHVIIESKPDSTLEDLRLDVPFPELEEYMKNFNLDSMTRKQLVHVPYLVLVHKYLQEWRTINSKPETAIPSNRKEKDHLKDLISTAAKYFTGKLLAQDPEDARDVDLSNFDEAVKAINSILVDSHKIPASLEQLFNETCIDARKNGKFYLMLRGLREFYSQHKTLPLRGSLPDMTSDSKTFVELQKIYRSKAQDDVNKLMQIIHNIDTRSLESSGLLPIVSSSEIDPSEVALFCKNAPYLSVIKTSSINEEYAKKKDESNSSGRLSCREKLKQLVLDDEVSNDKDSVLGYYLMFRSIDQFYSHSNRLPGVIKERMEEDIVELKGCFREVLSDIGVSSSVAASSRDDLIQGFVAFGASEIHSVASFMGGIAGQETIKLITNQFVPVNHTLLYNGITASVETLTF